MTWVTACSTVPEESHETYSFPKQAFVGIPKLPFKALGSVKTRVNYSTLTSLTEGDDLCQNYYHKAVQQLLDLAKQNGGDAVIQVRSVVFHMDGSSQSYKTAECFDNGAEGQVLTRGIAIRWKNPKQINSLETQVPMVQAAPE